ncbi:NK-tumor recognition protein isoform X1 [Tachysurus vachellii]|uniref:NK-tumor recognition protein isoform X1 n=2 Tax=Tachysurus vachellii TaxID=175792 RepID=UPI00296A957E|nr:NK-tumor recognition protein isoform X1 [Tachysurus vachellii]XP_060718304.1 NK-tumor recognition protein isoform X1 [Tachysurus vachellii]XP_060718306.1 NK-tumor recognition protein isoform X1 [Tachysurus vachellii]
MGVKDRPQCYFDVEINREPVGRIVFQLFSDICPKTSKNFLWLCTGEKGTGKTTGKKLCYKGSVFHRVVKNFMIQGGDFTEGNGRGGESVYGGYFEDENFILKHDRAFLLSMANRGKDTNGSQFFITTKTAPHLDGVHVVFGSVISGFEVIKKIEGLKADAASRPYADVRVIDCGQLITKSANDVLEGRKRKAFYSEDDSQSSSDSRYSSFESGEESAERYSRRNKMSAKSKRSKRRRKEVERKERRREKSVCQGSHSERDMVEEEDGQKEHNVKREKPMVRPEEIPPVPENRFLLRRDMPAQEESTNIIVQDTVNMPNDTKPVVTKSGRKLKGRGTMRYHTPTRSISRSESEEERGSSETPPHWKEEMQRTKTYQPSSVQKWSKGERWDDRSGTPWSRSRSQEYSSDQDSDNSSQHHHYKKEKKKDKRKKKAKKRKHSKKHKKNKFREGSLSEREMSVSSGRRSKVSNYPPRRSYSRSLSPSTSRHSRRSYRSRSNRRKSLSPSVRRSRSYSRSRDKSYSRSRSRTGSRSKSNSSRSCSRSRSGSQSGRSITRSRSDSRSRSRYRTRSRSRSRYRSQSPIRKRNISKLPDGSSQKVKNPVPTPTHAMEPKATPSASAESVPVLPLSDSPPPSRWKPGQKPWKPSYVRNQEIKAKKDLPSQALMSQTPGMPLETLSNVQSQIKKSTSNKGLSSSSHYSGKNKQPESLLRKSSSRSRSSSHSRSRSHSSYQSMSPGQYSRSSSSSSFSRSDSYYSYRRTSSEKREKRHSSHRRDHKRIKNVIYSPVKEDSSPSHSDGTDSTHGPIQRHSISKAPEDALDPLPDLHIKAEKKLKSSNASVLAATNSKSGSGWESDNGHLSKLASGDESKPPQVSVKEESGLSEKKKMKIWAHCWDSESESEMAGANNGDGENKPASEKEEGEASSESEVVEPTGFVNKPDQLSKVSEGFKNSEEHSNDYSKTEKHKSKKAKRKHKHKRRNSDRSSSQRVKTKTKRSKKKRQKPKETFHWQPPLEFGEEGEEDDSLPQAKNIDPANSEGLTELVKRTQLKSQHVVSKENSKMSHDSSKESCSTAEISKSGDESSNLTKRQQLKLNTDAAKSPAQSKRPQIASSQSNVNAAHAQDETNDQDDMEICTPEHKADANTEKPEPFAVDLPNIKDTVKNGTQLLLPQTDQKKSGSNPVLTPPNRAGEPTPGSVGLLVDPKWKPLKGMTVVPAVSAAPLDMKMNRSQEQGEGKTQGLKIEIKSKNRVRPGSLFDEVRKTARLNQRPRNQDSSSEEGSPASTGEQTGSQKHSRSKSRSVSSSRPRRRDSSRSYTPSRSRSRSSSYSSRSYSRSQSRRGYSREHSRSRSSSYQRYRSHTYSRSRSRSRSRGRCRSRSYTYDSYSSRSRSRRSRYRRSESSDRRSRSYRSYSRSSSRHGSHSSRYS